MTEEYTPEELDEMRSVSTSFNHWLNSQVRAERVRVHTLAEIVAHTYLRMRMYLSDIQAQAYLSLAVQEAERQIQSGKLEVMTADGLSTIPYFTVEDMENKPGIREMLHASGKEITDEDIARLLEG